MKEECYFERAVHIHPLNSDISDSIPDTSEGSLYKDEQCNECNNDVGTDREPGTAIPIPNHVLCIGWGCHELRNNFFIPSGFTCAVEMTIKGELKQFCVMPYI